jgi:cellobiose transport system permease protein
MTMQNDSRNVAVEPVVTTVTPDLRYGNVGLAANTAGAGAAAYTRKQANRIRRTAQNLNPSNRRPGILTYVFLTVVFLISIFPLFAALMYGSATIPELAMVRGNLPRWIPSGALLNNFSRILNHSSFSFWGAFRNSVLVAVITSAATVFFSTLAAFSFSKLNFRGKSGLYTTIIATMAIPAQIGTIPMFILMAQFGWIDSLASLIIPALVSAFGVFWMTQYMSGALPYELIEAARVDGASMFRTFLSVAWPAARPAAATLALFTFVGSWNSYFWTRIMLRSQHTLPLIIPMLNGAFARDVPAVLAGVFLVALPLLIVFVFLGKQLVAGVMAGAVKG